MRRKVTLREPSKTAILTLHRFIKAALDQTCPEEPGHVYEVSNDALSMLVARFVIETFPKNYMAPGLRAVAHALAEAAKEYGKIYG